MASYSDRVHINQEVDRGAPETLQPITNLVQQIDVSKGNPEDQDRVTFMRVGNEMHNRYMFTPESVQANRAVQTPTIVRLDETKDVLYRPTFEPIRIEPEYETITLE